MTASRPRALLVDLDDTAYAYAPCHQAGLDAAGAEAAAIDPAWAAWASFEADFAAARRAVKQTTGPSAARHSRLLYFKRMVEARFGWTRADLIRRLDDAYWFAFLAAMRPEPGCAELLADLAARGVALAWVTNFTTERQLDKLLRLGLDRIPAVLITSEEAGADKPDPRVVALALARLGVAAEATWMVGDDQDHDVAAALAADLVAIWFCRGEATPGGPAAHHVVRSWIELRGLVERGDVG